MRATQPTGQTSEACAAVPRYWLAVACANHVARGVAGGFMQVCHGKAGPLRRMQPGDGVVYYSPSTEMGGKDRLQSFTALGTLQSVEPYVFDMGGGFVPWRRDVHWLAAHAVPVAPLLERMQWSRGQRNWGYRLRFGVLEIAPQDFACIAQQFGVQAPLLQPAPALSVAAP